VVELAPGTSRPKGSGVRSALLLRRYLLSDMGRSGGGRSIREHILYAILTK
jgi:hypothetical protein